MHARKKLVAVAAPALAVALALGAAHKTARATGEDPTEANERCATRLAIALTGKSAPDALMTSTDPRSAVDTMLQSKEFEERFARFVNAKFNRIPGSVPSQDAAYWMTRYVIENNLAWKQMFVAQTSVVDDGNGNVTVQSDPNGLGYFRSDAWLKRYAGNEVSGLKIVTANRILNNTIGLKLVASTNAPGADLTATGRQQQPCAGCHYEPYFALDKVAKVLTRRNGTGDDMTFTDPPAADVPQTILGGKTISNDADLVNALVESDTFRFAQCRLAFQFLYDRPENECEGAVFDKCMDGFAADGKIQTAIATIAKDPSFCE